MHFLKSKLLKKGLCALVVSATIALFVGCGGQNNENGVSFTFLGYYEDTNGDVGRSAYTIPLSSLISEAPTRTILGLLNNLQGEFIRLRTANYSYEMPGSTLPLPNSQSALGGIIGPTVVIGGGAGGGGAGGGGAGGGAGGAGLESFESSLPEGFASNPVGNILYTTVGLISPQFSKYLRDNRARLPETPFEIVATVSVTGQSSSGEIHTTNSESILIRVLGDDSVEFFVPEASPSPTTTVTELDEGAENEEQLEELF